jgi:pimeloyl-ACP methyl ester carboxylesterase
MSKVQKYSALYLFPVLLVATLCGTAAAQQHLEGTFPDGAAYVIDVPAHWNKTLVLYSHGYNSPGNPNPAYDAGDGFSQYYLLTNGFALAGSGYATTGWAVQDAFQDQIAVLDTFQSLVGTPAHTIAWGHSLGGMITAGLVQKYPDRFSAALPMCGVVGGGVGLWNEFLDQAYAFNLLVANKTLQITGITDPAGNLNNAEAYLYAAQGTPQGRARIALVAALGDVVGWVDPAQPEPAPTDYATRETNQFVWLANANFLFMFYLRTELETRAGGNFSWNTGVNYTTQLKHSSSYAEVQALYSAAGLDLNLDLTRLGGVARVSANPAAVAYLSDNVIYNGQISVPVLTLHTTGDGLVSPENERAYKTTIQEAGNGSLLRQAFVHRGGHCSFTPAETIAAFQTLNTRMLTGKWKSFSPAALNNAAFLLGPNYNVMYVNGNPVYTAPEFEQFLPLKFLRPFDGFSQ